MSTLIHLNYAKFLHDVQIKNLKENTMANKLHFNSEMLDTAILQIVQFSSKHPNTLKEELIDIFEVEIAQRIAELVNQGKLQVDANFNVCVTKVKN